MRELGRALAALSCTLAMAFAMGCAGAPASDAGNTVAAGSMPAAPPGSMPAVPPGSMPAVGVGAERLARLARGINLSGWFWLEGGSDPARRFADADFDFLRSLGFSYARVPVSLDFVLAGGEEADPARVAAIVEGSRRLIARGLAACVDIQATSERDSAEANYAGALERDPAFEATYVAAWKALARALSALDPGMLFIEPQNEPRFNGRGDEWQALQGRVVAAIRAEAPRHTILATSWYWSSAFTLERMEKLPDDNIVYNFHFYDPVFFSNQGITWGGWAGLDLGAFALPYPSSPEAVAPILGTIEDPVQRLGVALYGEQRWDAARLRSVAALAAAWGRRNGVPVVCNEFGCNQRGPTKDADRWRWLADARRALEAEGIGWAAFDYDSPGYGLLVRDGELRKPLPEMARSLGLAGYPDAEKAPAPSANAWAVPSRGYPARRLEGGGFFVEGVAGYPNGGASGAAVYLDDAAGGRWLLASPFPAVPGAAEEMVVAEFSARLGDLEGFSTKPGEELEIAGRAVRSFVIAGRLEGDALSCAGACIFTPGGGILLGSVAAGIAGDEAAIGGRAREGLAELAAGIRLK